jgi:predicted unusual protein kinase regulating ubiquinone biosynthesis (AarF/ABC1/UbiB family)
VSPDACSASVAPLAHPSPATCPCLCPQLTLEKGYCNPFKPNLPELIASTALSSPVEVGRTMARGLEVVTRLGIYAGGLALDRLRGLGDSNVPLRAAQVRDLLCVLGPTYIKAGQVLASRPDIVRADYMEELATLQDDVPSFSDAQAFDIIEKELGGRTLDEVFEVITPRPIAAASLGQVYKARLRPAFGGADVAVKVQRPGIEPVVFRDLWLLRQLSFLVNAVAIQRLGCNATLVIDEFGEKLLEELDYRLEARNMTEFGVNFKDSPSVKIPAPYPALSSQRVLTMEWIDGVRCTNPAGIAAAGIDVNTFIATGVESGLRQLLEFGLFHGDPHPGNIFALQDGRIAYVDFGNVAQLSQRNKEVLIDAVVHAVNEDYDAMAGDFIQLGFLVPGTDVRPIVPALESIWSDAATRSLSNFNFRTVTNAFNKLVYQYPIRIPERFSLVIRSLLTQEGICMTLSPDFRFLQIAYPYVAKRLLTDSDTSLRDRLIQVLFKGGQFQVRRLENLVTLAASASGGLDLSNTLADGARLFLVDDELRTKLLAALTDDDRLHTEEVRSLIDALTRTGSLQPDKLAASVLRQAPELARNSLLGWSQRVLAN